MAEYYVNGQLLSKAHYDHGLLNDDQWREYYDNGALHNVACVRHGRQEGLVKEFYPDGHIKTVGQYKAGKREGVFNLYKDEGWRWFEESFTSDHLTRRREYDAEGHLMMEQFYFK